MTKDLQKTLKVSDYPFMKIRFTEFSKDLDDYVKAGRIEGEADIELAGVTRHMNIALSVIPGAAGQVQLIGVKQILLVILISSHPVSWEVQLRSKMNCLLSLDCTFKPDKTFQL